LFSLYEVISCLVKFMLINEIGRSEVDIPLV
jgi:hypothetical protein